MPETIDITVVVTENIDNTVVVTKTIDTTVVVSETIDIETAAFGENHRVHTLISIIY